MKNLLFAFLSILSVSVFGQTVPVFYRTPQNIPTPFGYDTVYAKISGGYDVYKTSTGAWGYIVVKNGKRVLSEPQKGQQAEDGAYFVKDYTSPSGARGKLIYTYRKEYADWEITSSLLYSSF